MPRPYVEPPRCPRSGNKIIYGSSRLAEEALAELRAKRARQGIDQVEDHSYPCTKCGGHHVSSEEELPVERAYGRGRRRRSPRGRR